MAKYPKVPFTEIATLIRGVSYDKSVASVSEREGYIPILRANNIQKNLVLADLVYVPSNLVKEEQMIRKEDIVLAMSSGSKDLVGKSAQADTNIDAAFGTFCGLIRAKENVDSKFLGLYFQTQEYRNFVSYQSQGVNICNLKKKDIESLQISLPPLPTQQAIVSRIETLFAELDKGVEHLRTAQQQIKTYRQAVLNHWLNNDDGKWEMVNISCFLDNSCKGMMTGPFGTALKKSEHKSCGIPVLGIENIGEGSFVMPNKIFVTEEKAKELKTFAVKTDDIIISRSGTVGEICKVPFFMNDALLSTNLIRIRLNLDLINADYFVLLFQSSQIKQQVKDLCKGTTRAFLNQTILSQISFPYPPLSEQQRIVAEIESRLSQAEAVEASIGKALQQAEALRQSILKKAFNGELI